MTSPRGSSAVGRSTGGDDGRAASAAGADHAGVLTAEAPRAEASQPGRAGDESPAYQAGPAWARWLPPAAALLISLWGISTPSYWRDEAATIAAIRRPLGDLIRMLGNVDAVHGAYYLMMWPLEHVLGLRCPGAEAAVRDRGRRRGRGHRRHRPPPDLALGWAGRGPAVRGAARDEHVRPGGSLVRHGDDSRRDRELPASPRAPGGAGRPPSLADLVRGKHRGTRHPEHLRPAARPGARGHDRRGLPPRPARFRQQAAGHRLAGSSRGRDCRD